MMEHAFNLEDGPIPMENKSKVDIIASLSWKSSVGGSSTMSELLARFACALKESFDLALPTISLNECEV